MKLLKFLNPKKDKKPLRNYGYRLSPFAQTSGSDNVLRRISARKRGMKASKIMFRMHHGLVKKIFIILLLLGLFSFVIYKFNLLNYFKISEVTIFGANKFVNEKDVKEVAERNVKGQSIFLVNIGSLSDVIYKSFLGAKNVVIEKDYPSTIKVNIQERIPMAVLYNDSGEYYLIDTDGYVLGVVEQKFSNLPEIKYEDEIIVGSFLEKEMIPVSIEILKFAEKENLKISSMSFFPKYTKLYAGRDTEVFIGYDKDREESLRVVNALIKKLELEGKTVKKIDLRYDKVIVLYD